MLVKAEAVAEGSPPRVRGKQSMDSIKNQVKRITPACAGKTATLERALSEPEDHPRVCGENRSSAR